MPTLLLVEGFAAGQSYHETGTGPAHSKSSRISAKCEKYMTHSIVRRLIKKFKTGIMQSEYTDLDTSNATSL